MPTVKYVTLDTLITHRSGIVWIQVDPQEHPIIDRQPIRLNGVLIVVIIGYLAQQVERALVPQWAAATPLMYCGSRRVVSVREPLGDSLSSTFPIQS